VSDTEYKQALKDTQGDAEASLVVCLRQVADLTISQATLIQEMKWLLQVTRSWLPAKTRMAACSRLIAELEEVK